MENKDWLRRLDWGHIFVVLGIAAGISLYLLDAINASSKVGNLVLILPASVLGLILCLLIIAGIVIQARKGPDEKPAMNSDGDEAPETVYERARPAIMLGLFAAYVLLIPVLGMDGGSALFLAAALWVNGERRIGFIIGYAIVFAAAATWFFKSILPYPLHTIFF